MYINNGDKWFKMKHVKVPPSFIIPSLFGDDDEIKEFTLISYEYYRWEVDLLIGNHTHTRSQITDFAHTHTFDQITNLQGELNRINGEINNVKKALGDIDDGSGGPDFWDWLFGGINTGLTAASFAALQSQVGSIQGQIANMQAQIAALQSRLGMDVAPDIPSSGWFNRLSDWWSRVTRFLNSGYQQMDEWSSDIGAETIRSELIRT
jgi:hypothetical protein